MATAEGPATTTIPTTTTTQQSNILTSRNRLQPDLVMDLPLTQDNTTPPLSSGSASASSSLQSLDKLQSQAHEDTEDSMTLGEHFAKQNQCTLKKNEKFSDNSPNTKKPMAEVKPQDMSSSTSSKESTVDEVVLRIEESTDVSIERMSTGSTDSQSSTSSAVLKIDLEKSPIPARNTQKFISQFADLKLTGGCSTNLSTPTTASATTSKAEKPEKERSSFISSFKPQLKVKPQILMKKPSLFLHGHSAPSSSSSSPNNQQN